MFEVSKPANAAHFDNDILRRTDPLSILHPLYDSSWNVISCRNSQTEIMFLPRFRFSSDERSPNSRGNAASDKLQLNRLKVTKERGRDPRYILGHFLVFQSQDLIIMFVLRGSATLSIEIPSARSSFSDSIAFKPAGKVSRLEQPAMSSVSRDFNAEIVSGSLLSLAQFWSSKRRSISSFPMES
nr:hypothetical protein Iba_chr01bCG8670 [Ipomoea batatas]